MVGPLRSWHVLLNRFNRNPIEKGMMVPAQHDDIACGVGTRVRFAQGLKGMSFRVEFDLRDDEWLLTDLANTTVASLDLR